MNIASARIDALAHQLAELTGEDVETAVAHALEEKISRTAPVDREARNAALRAFFQKLREMPVLDPRTPDEIMGFDAKDLPN